MTIPPASERLALLDTARTASRPNGAPDAAYWVEQMDSVCRRRDRQSFLRIYDHFSPRVRMYLTGLGCPKPVAQELSQDAMLRVWQRAELYDGSRSALSTWIFRIARNLYIDRLRKEPQWLLVQEEVEQVAEREDPVAPSPERAAEHLHLDRCIDQLPATQARLIRMSYLEAKSHREIAAELDLPIGTVKSHIRRAFQRLQAAMRGDA